MNLVIGKNSFLSKSLSNWLVAQYVSYKDIAEIDLRKYDTVYVLSQNPVYKYKKQIEFNFEKKIFEMFSDKKIIYISSSKVYPYKMRCDENTLLDPQNVYGENKIKIENILRNYTNKYFIYRISNVFTKFVYAKDSFLDIFYKNYYNQNKIILDYSRNSIKDFITLNSLESIFKNMEKSNNYGIYNLGSMKGLKVNKIIKILLKDIFSKIEFIENNIQEKNQTLNISKICKICNFKINQFHLETLKEFDRRK